MDGDERLPPLEDLPTGAYSGGYELEGRMARAGEDDAYSEREPQIMPQEDMLDRMDQIRRMDDMVQMDQRDRRGRPVPPGAKIPAPYPAVGSTRADRYVVFAFWVIEISLAIRVILRLMAGNPDAAFTTLVYALTWPFVAFFADVFPSPSGRGHALDAPAILALFIYPLVAWAIVRLIQMRQHHRTRLPT